MKTQEELLSEITNLKQQLIEKEKLLTKNTIDSDQIIDILKDFVFILDAKGFIIKTNYHTLNRLGFSADEIKNKKYIDIYPADCRKYIISNLANVKRKEESTSDLPLITKQGEEIPVETTFQQKKWGNKNIIIAISKDISEKVSDLNENIFFSSVFENLKDIVVVKDINYRVIACNNTFLEIANVDNKSKVLHKTYAEIFSNRDKYTFFSRAEIDDKTTSMLNKGEFLEKEEGILCSDKLLRTYATKKIPVYNKHNTLIGIINIANNITERKNIEHNLKISKSQLATQKTMIEQKNEALSEVIRHIERDKEYIFKNMYDNIDNFIQPIVKKLKLRSSPDKVKFFDLLENNLAEITSSFGNNISNKIKQDKLTSREIEICNMIKNGLTSKEISSVLNISSLTIDKHRLNIRKKFGILRSDNLSIYLKSI